MRNLISAVSLFSSHSNRSSLRKRLLIAGLALASSSAFLTGCGSSPTAFTAGSSSTTGSVALTGKVHGGQQPVAGAHVYFYKAGSTGYGTGAASLLTSAVLSNNPAGGKDAGNNYYVVTDGSGQFTITGDYTCASTDQVYIIATGGNPGTGTNANLALMAGLGSCGALTSSTFINLNEVTTVASAYALQQFMTTAPAVGATGTNATGLTNAFNTINNLVNTSTGLARTITPAYENGTTVSGTTYPVVAYLNSSTVPQSRINTLADIVAACVNTTGGTAGDASACGTLFTAATPSGGSAPTDTLQAILNVAKNPGTNVASLYGLSSTNAPFQPSLTSQPNDWTLALSFSSGGLGGNPGTSSPIVSVAVNYNTLAIDQNGNVFVGAIANDTVATPLIAAFNPLGAPLTVPTTINASTSTEVAGGHHGAGSYFLSFDPTGNLWSATSGSTGFYKSASDLSTTASLSSAASVYALAVDGSSNIWVGVGTALAKNLYKYDSTGTLTNTYTGVTGTATYSRDYTFDSNDNLWFKAGYSSLYSAYVANNGSKIASYSGEGYGSKMAAGASGNIYECNAAGTAINVYNASTTTGTVATYSLAQGCAGANMAVDGLGNIWTANSSGTFLQELNSSGTLLTSSTGYSGTSSSESTTLHATPTGLAIDGSGNLWVANVNTGSAGSTAYNALVEYVGAAAPVTTPLSLAINYAEVGVRP